MDSESGDEDDELLTLFLRTLYISVGQLRLSHCAVHPSTCFISSVPSEVTLCGVRHIMFRDLDMHCFTADVNNDIIFMPSPPTIDDRAIMFSGCPTVQPLTSILRDVITIYVLQGFQRNSPSQIFIL